MSDTPESDAPADDPMPPYEDREAHVAWMWRQEQRDAAGGVVEDGGAADDDRERFSDALGAILRIGKSDEEETAEDGGVEPAPVVEYRPRRPIMTVNLDEPFAIDGRQIRAIELRSPRIDTAHGFLMGNLSRMDLYADMTGLPVATLNALRWQDGNRVFGAANVLIDDLGVTP